MLTDFHTHNLEAVPGTAIVNLPKAALLQPEKFCLKEGGLYSVGIHPWWTLDEDMESLWNGFEYWLKSPQVIAIGECGLDRLKGASLDCQKSVFLRQASKAEQQNLPVTIHCVRSFDLMLQLHKQYRPAVAWTIHGFRGKPVLARQLLQAGFNLSFGSYYNLESWELTPADRRYRETDEDYLR